MRALDRLGVESGVGDPDLPAFERPAVGLLPEAVQNLQLVFHQVGAFRDLRERQPQLAVLRVVPASPNADFYPAATHLVDRRHDFGERSRMTERDRRDERAQANALGLARDPGQDRPGVCRRPIGRAGEAAVMVGSKEGLEADSFGQPGQVELIPVRQALLSLDHQREAHRHPPARRRGGGCAPPRRVGCHG